MTRRSSILTLALVFGIATAASAMQCPKAVPGITFVHPVIPAAPAQPWQINTTDASHGWAIVSNPVTESSQQKTVYSSAPLTVTLSQQTGSQVFTVACDYQLESGSYPLELTVVYTMPHPSPTNRLFKKVGDSRYVCTTDAAHPETCSDADIHQAVCGLGKSC